MIKRQSAVVIIAILFLPVASTALADDKAGWGMSAGIGASRIKDRDDEGTFEGGGFGYNWGLEYRFSRRWALGVDLFSLGRASDTVDSVDTTITVGGFDLRGRLIFPLSDSVEIYGRAGFAGYFADVDPGDHGCLSRSVYPSKTSSAC